MLFFKSYIKGAGNLFFRCLFCVFLLRGTALPAAAAGGEIFPDYETRPAGKNVSEGKNIPDKWVDMIAAGDRNLANEYLEQYVHKIGNLTVTGYNSTLSNLSFVEKRDRLNAQKLYVGYKNGLEINKELAEKDAWTVQDIIDRTDELVEMLLDMYKL